MKPAGEAGKLSMMYPLRITSAKIDPAIWRLVEVLACSLGELHDVIQIVMGWQDSHMHQFILNGRRQRSGVRASEIEQTTPLPHS